MGKRITSLLILIVAGISTPGIAQTTQLDTVLMKNGIMQLCPRLPYLKDSMAIQVNLDSIAILMTGRWSLRIIESGWASPVRPEKKVELVLDRQGKGTIHEDGQSVATIEFFIRRKWAMIRFDLNQQGQSIIRLDVSKQSGGQLHVCGEKLFIGNGYADGTLYAFRRIQ